MSSPDDPSSSRIRVLYVDEDGTFSELVQSELESLDDGIDLTTVADRGAALAALDERPIDCLVTAYELPEGTGIELAAAVERRATDVPVVLFTDSGSERTAAEATRAGVTDYVPVRDDRDDVAFLGRRIRALTEGDRDRHRADRDRRRADRAADGFRRIMERTTDAVYAVDEDWTIEYMNERMADRFDRDRDAVVGNDLWEEFPGIVGTEFEERYRTAMRTGTSVRFEQYLREPYDCWVEVQAFPDETGLTVFLRDGTERDEGGRELRRVNRRLEALTENTDEAIYIKDCEGHYRMMNEAAADLFGLSPERVVGKHDRDLFDAESAAAIREVDETILETGEPDTREAVRWIDGRRHVFLDNKYPYRNADGDIVGIMGISRDITDRKERERELERVNQRLESLFEAAPLAVMEVAPGGEVLRWNRGATEMFGWTGDEIIGEFMPIVPEDRQAEFEAYRQRALSGERIRGEEIRRRDRDGEPLDLLLSAAPVLDDGGNVQSIIAVLEDITAQKRAERQLRALQQTARELNLAESVTAVGELAVEAAGEILDLPLTGVWRYAEARDALLPVTMSEGAAAVLDRQPRFEPGDSLAWAAFEAGEVRTYSNLRETSDRQNPDTPMGSEIIVPLGDQGLMITGSTDPREFSDRDVDLFRTLGATTQAAMVRAEREAELRRQNDRLDQFASVVAHDLRNPLSVASGYLDLARNSSDPSRPARNHDESSHLDRIESAHDRMDKLIDQLLALARGESTVTDTERRRLEDLVEAAWEHVDTGRATVTVAEDAGELRGDPDRLLQLFENLSRNAIEHAGEGVAVSVGPLEDGDGFYVADDGPGIPPDRRDEVFDHGVSYSDNGTGLGLAIVADVARSHGWEVAVTESADGGARFEFSAVTVPD